MTFAWLLGAAESTLGATTCPPGDTAWPGPYFEDVQIERLHGARPESCADPKITTASCIPAPTSTRRRTWWKRHRFWTRSAAPSSAPASSMIEGQMGVVTASLQNTPTSGPVTSSSSTGWHHKPPTAPVLRLFPGLRRKRASVAARRQGPVGTDTGPWTIRWRDHAPLQSTGEAQGGYCVGGTQNTRHRPAAKVLDDFPDWEPWPNRLCRASTALKKTSAVTWTRSPASRRRGVPWRWVGGDGCIVRLVAIVGPTGTIASRPEGGLMKLARASQAPGMWRRPHHEVSTMRLQGREARRTEILGGELSVLSGPAGQPSRPGRKTVVLDAASYVVLSTAPKPCWAALSVPLEAGCDRPHSRTGRQALLLA